MLPRRYIILITVLTSFVLLYMLRKQTRSRFGTQVRNAVRLQSRKSNFWLPTQPRKKELYRRPTTVYWQRIIGTTITEARIPKTLFTTGTTLQKTKTTEIPTTTVFTSTTQKVTTISSTAKPTTTPMKTTTTIISTTSTSKLTTSSRSTKRPKSRKELIKERREMMKKRKLFEPIMTARDKALFLNLLKVFHNVLVHNKVMYAISGGTLLGSYRHHGFVPWDDDLDVIVNVTARPMIEKYFQHLRPDYIMQPAGARHKFYHKSSLPITPYSWKWPYIDITFVKDNGTHLTETASAYGVSLSYPRQFIMPLHKRPLENLWLYSPRDAFGTLVWSYGVSDECRMIGYSHMMEAGDKAGRIPCKDLANKYAFVRHSVDVKRKRMKEELLKDGKVLHTFYTKEPMYAVCKTYALRLKNRKLPKNLPWPNRSTPLI